MSPEIKQLVIRAKNGNVSAFSKLYKEYFDKIYRFLFFSTRNKELSEDLAQETFIRSWKAIGSFSTRQGSFQAYLYAIARNLVVDWRRKKKTISLEVIAEYPSTENIEEDLIKKDTKEKVWNAITTLKETDQQLIVLRFFEELSYTDLAKIFDEKEATLRVKTFRVLKELKICLKKYEN